MPMNPLPPAGGPGAAAAATGGPGRKEEAASTDPGFTALLLALVGGQMMMPPAMPVQPATEEGVVTSEVPQTAVAVAPAAVTLPEQLETMLQAQRVTLPEAALPEAEASPVPTQEGVWVVQPLPQTAVTVQAPTTDAGPQEEKPSDQKAALDVAPAPELPHFAAAHTAAVHHTEGSAPSAPGKAPAAIPSPIEPDRLMDAIAKSAVSSGDGRYTVTLRLNPEQLGEVRLQLHVAGREVQTVLQVANPEARQLLEQRSDQLRDSLTQSGLTLSGFHVATGQEERQRDAREQFEQLNPRRRGRQTAPIAAVGGMTARPILIPSTRRTSGFDTLA